MSIVKCSECGEPGNEINYRNGKCHDCRGITLGSKTPAGVRQYVSPDDVEARKDALDHAEMEARERTVENTRTQE